MDSVDYIDSDYVINLAERIVSEVATSIQKKIYKAIGKTLRVRWTDREYFTAYAYEENSDTHHIVLSEGMALELYRDALSLSEMAATHFTETKYWKLFGPPDSERIGVLPAGKSVEECKEIMFEISLKWIFFHELAHLGQAHLEIRREFGDSTDLKIVDEAYADDQRDIVGKEAIIYHATELAADHEGLSTALQFLAIKYDNAIPKADVYMLVCGLTCLFNKFYGSRSDGVIPIPDGSHPHPAVRWELLLPAFYGYFFHPEVKRRYPEWNIEEKDVVHMLTEANGLASMYWAIQYAPSKVNGGLPRFMKAADVDNKPEVKQYLRTIFSAMDEIFPKITELYRFPFRPSIPIITPEWRKRVLEKPPGDSEPDQPTLE